MTYLESSPSVISPSKFSQNVKKSSAKKSANNRILNFDSEASFPLLSSKDKNAELLTNDSINGHLNMLEAENAEIINQSSLDIPAWTGLSNNPSTSQHVSRSSFPSLFTLTDMNKTVSAHSKEENKISSSLTFEDFEAAEDRFYLNKGDLYNFSNHHLSSISASNSPARRPYQSYFKFANITSQTPKSKKKLQLDKKSPGNPVTDRDGIPGSVVANTSELISPSSKHDFVENDLKKSHAGLSNNSGDLFEFFHFGNLNNVQSVLKKHIRSCYVESLMSPGNEKDGSPNPQSKSSEQTIPKNEHYFEINQLSEFYKSLFPEWHCQLSLGFHLLFYGYGSKRKLLNQFCSHLLPHYRILFVDGCHGDLSIDAVLNKWQQDIDLQMKHLCADTDEDDKGNHDISLKIKSKGYDKIGALFQKLALLQKKIKSSPHQCVRPYLIVFLNIDGFFARQNHFTIFTNILLKHVQQNPLSFYLMASMDHIHGPLLWSSSFFDRAKWLFVDATQYVPYTLEELKSIETSVISSQMTVPSSSLDALISSSKPSSSRATSGVPVAEVISSVVDAQQKLGAVTVLTNLTINARKLFALLAKLQLQWYEAVIENELEEYTNENNCESLKRNDEYENKENTPSDQTTPTNQDKLSTPKKSKNTSGQNFPVINTPKRALQSSLLLQSLSTPPRFGAEESSNARHGLSSKNSITSPLTNAKGKLSSLNNNSTNSNDALEFSGITFSQYYQLSKENFLVSNEMTFRTQLIEFFDHKIIASRRTILPTSTYMNANSSNSNTSQGNIVEVLYIPFSHTCIIEIIECIEKL